MVIRPGIDRDAMIRRAAEPARDALRLHAAYRGKIQVLPKCPVRDLRDLAVWYTPGVAEPCTAIRADPGRVYEYTNKANSVAVISNGTRVLGLGDIGPEAGLPVMEGKALLFKYLGGVDAVPLCLATRDVDEFVRTVEILQPSFGAINLEDIAQPSCFRILDRLRTRLSIPVWHDDQQGTGVVVLAGLLNALTVVGKNMGDVRIVLVGFGAANVASYRLLHQAGADPAAFVVCDSRGILHPGRSDVEACADEFPDKWHACLETNADGVRGGVAEALRGADVCVAFSRPGPDVIQPPWITAMRHDPIVFACANPTPEIWPWDAHEAGARIVATGRSDLPNQLNNSLGFPAIFRGVLDVRARSITDGMALVAAHELARCARDRGIHEDSILPTMAEWDVAPRVAVATGLAAQRDGVAQLDADAETLLAGARRRIADARAASDTLLREGVIQAPAVVDRTAGTGS
jgi:malate dehydrogenase (oxaloacetate-decarboxylating)